MLADQLAQPRVDFLPGFDRADGRQLARRHFDRQIQLANVAGIDDVALRLARRRRRSACPRESARFRPSAAASPTGRFAPAACAQAGRAAPATATRCEPRLSRASAWISSTITVRTLRSISRLFAPVSSKYSDSGVVTRICGGLRSIACRSLRRRIARANGDANRLRLEAGRRGSRAEFPRAAPADCGGCRCSAP